MVGAATPQEVRAMLVEMSRGIQAEGLARAVAFRLSNFFSPDHAHHMSMPVLMLQGSEDRINPREENADLLLPQLSQGRLDVLAGVGHLPEAEVPSLYAQKVAEFLSA
jgi:pimeloyl-ACP methyl ester carboxylesterase